MPDSSPNPPPSRGPLFLSYARGDQESFVARLHGDLAARGLALWWDRRCMPNRGLTFLREIREAITAAERLLLIFEPRAVESDYVRAEWQYAGSIGTPVLTLLRVGNYEQLPEALRHSDVLDFREDEQYPARLATLLRQLAEPISPLGRLLGVPELPPQFQARVQDLTAVRGALLRDSREPVVLTSAGRRAGMQGMGGIGKSVLAAAVVRDFEVRRSFPDGVIWVALGQRPNLALRLAETCHALGDAPGSFSEGATGRARLGELLAHRACLLVLDDAWQLEHVGAFDALGPRTALLVTTRDERLLDELGAHKHRLEVLAPEEALRLMAGWLAAPTGVLARAAEAEAQAIARAVAAMPAEAGEVARECGYLPLALALSAAQVRDGVAWSSVLEALREADLQYLDHPNGSVFRSIKISVDALEREDPRQARHYLELAVFPQGAAVPEAAVRTLWQRPGGLNPRTADKLLATLARRALLRLEGEAPRRTLQLHDLQHDFARTAAGDPAALHGMLLEAYRQSFAGDWPLGPDDGYYFQHLAAHLAGAGRVEEMKTLLTASPAWLEAQFKACRGDTQFAADLELALATPAAERPLARIALLAARQVIRRRVETYSDDDLETLVHLGRGAEALSHARLRSDPARRLRALVRLHRAGGAGMEPPPDLLGEGLAFAAQLAANEYESRVALAELSLALFEADRGAEALEIARRTEGGVREYHSRDSLVEALENQQRFPEAAAVARTSSEAKRRVEELLAVARAARKTGQLEFGRSLLDEAAAEVHAAKEPDPTPTGYQPPWRTRALQAAAELLEPDTTAAHARWSEALEVILEQPGTSNLDLKEIGLKLAPRGETQLVLRAMDGSSYPQSFRNDEARQFAAAAGAAAQFETALAIAAVMDDPAVRAQTLVALLPPLHAARDNRFDPVATKALALAGRIKKGDFRRARTLCELTETLASLSNARAAEAFERALADARRAPRKEAASALARVARSVARSDFAATEPLRQEALELAAGDQSECWNVAVLLAESGDLDRALLAARQVEAKNQWSVINSVAEALAEAGLAAKARAAVNATDDPEERYSRLGKVAEKLARRDPAAAGGFFQEALACRSWPLKFIVYNLARSPSCWTPELIDAALETVPYVAESGDQQEALQKFLPGLAAPPWQEACTKLIDTARRLKVLPGLADELAAESDKALQAGDFDTALLLGNEVRGEAKHSRLLERIANALAAAGDERALAVARSLAGPSRVAALEAVALSYARAGHPEAARILEEKRVADSSHTDAATPDAAVREVLRALLGLGVLDGALATFPIIAAERERTDALCEAAAALLAGGGLSRGLQAAEALGEPLLRARALLAFAQATGDSALFDRALREASTDAAPPDQPGADWIAALGESVVRLAATDEALARRLVAAAQATCALIPDRERRSDQQALIARHLSRAGWFADALAAARAVEDGRQHDYGAVRGNTVAVVAGALAKAGRAAEARAAAVEADEIITQAVWAIISQAPMMPPEGYDSETRRHIESLLAGTAPPDGTATIDPSSAASHDWRDALDVPVVDEFIAALARSSPLLEREAPGLALAGLKEATRIAGWASETYRRVSEAISAASDDH
ncbi:MAG: hypothetical protein QOE70_2882 [Chthoniobacter sp.]|jgi:hypothetical protein|nr:hypothetical protein [Chthoniobacter sp.]